MILTISVMTVGQSDVRCCGEILRIRTRKHKKTCACIVGMEETFKLSVSLSASKMLHIFTICMKLFLMCTLTFVLILNYLPSKFSDQQQFLMVQHSTHEYNHDVRVTYLEYPEDISCIGPSRCRIQWNSIALTMQLSVQTLPPCY